MKIDAGVCGNPSKKTDDKYEPRSFNFCCNSKLARSPPVTLSRSHAHAYAYASLARHLVRIDGLDVMRPPFGGGLGGLGFTLPVACTNPGKQQHRDIGNCQRRTPQGFLDPVPYSLPQW